MEFDTYELVKVLHIIAVISWMAGLLYLPRIFVYHSAVKIGSESDLIFQTMERKLLRYIMNPAMIISLICGSYMIWEIGFEFVWLHIKLTLVAILIIFHHFLARWRKNFANGKNKHSAKFYRITNEIPTLAMIGIIFFVVIKPF